MASKKNPQVLFSRSNTSTARRHFHWSSTTNKVTTSEEEEHQNHHLHEDDLHSLKNHIQSTHKKSTAFSSSYSSSYSPSAQPTQQRRKLPAITVSRIRSVLVTAISTTYTHYKPSQLKLSASKSSLGPKVIGTLFGHRKGHVNFVFQREHNSSPVFFIELATPITTLVKEMASGLVRIALECDKQSSSSQGVDVNEEEVKVAQEEKNKPRTRRRREPSRKRLVEEPSWRAYCNGKKCGFAMKREPGPREMKVLKAVEPISMGAGVLPGFDGGGLSGPDGELMYMRAKFERVVGSSDSEAFYMMNPDCNGDPELSIYLLRV